MSKKIQTVIPDRIAEEINTVLIEDRFADQSEFVRHCIREYLNQRQLKSEELEAVIEELDGAADDLLNDGSVRSIEMGKEILAKAAPLKEWLKRKRSNVS